MNLFGKIFKWLGIGVYAVCAALIVMFLMPVGGWKALNVLTGSMKPTIQPGTLVLIHHVPLRDIKRGDIVTYQNPRNFTQTITHRVVKIEKVAGTNMVTVKGDANPTADSPFAGGLIVGRVVAVVPGAGQFINWLHNPFGLAALVIIPGILVIWAEVRRLQHALTPPEQLVRPQPARDLPVIPPATVAVVPEEPPARTKRSLDGMRRMSMLMLLPALVLLTVRATYSLGSVGQVRLTHNSFTAVQTLPTSADQCKKEGWKNFKNPDGSLMFKNQGQCVAFVESNGHSHNNITVINITNTNDQSATGNNASNSITTTTSVNVTN